MQEQQEISPIPVKQIRLILACGLIVSAGSIIASVDFLFRENDWLGLSIASSVFIAIIIIVRKLAYG